MGKWHLNVVATRPGGVLVMCKPNKTVRHEDITLLIYKEKKASIRSMCLY